MKPGGIDRSITTTVSYVSFRFIACNSIQFASRSSSKIRARFPCPVPSRPDAPSQQCRHSNDHRPVAPVTSPSPLALHRRIVPQIVHVFPRRSSIPRRSPHLLVFRKSRRRRRGIGVGMRRRRPRASASRDAVRHRHRERARDAQRPQRRSGHAMHRAFRGEIFVNRVRSMQVHHCRSREKSLSDAWMDAFDVTT